MSAVSRDLQLHPTCVLLICRLWLQGQPPYLPEVLNQHIRFAEILDSLHLMSFSMKLFVRRVGATATTADTPANVDCEAQRAL
jgi:hypothetical protein